MLWCLPFATFFHHVYRPDLKSCQAVHPGFNPGLSPQPITMSSNSAVASQVLLQPQPSNLTLFNAAAVNLQGKGTTPLTHIGFVSPNLQRNGSYISIDIARTSVYDVKFLRTV